MDDFDFVETSAAVGLGNLMSGPLVSFEVMLQIIQRIDSGAASFADASPLLGLAHRYLLEHRRDQHSHGRLLHWRE